MSEGLAFVLGRAASAAATLLLSSLIIFAAIHALPGGYADVFLGAYATPEAKARIERQFGLNDPLPAQYAKWLKSAAQGDFGVSLVTQKPVAEEFAARLPTTATIAALAAALALLIGAPAGLLAGLFSGSGAAQWVARLCGSLAISVPDFVIGTLLLYLVSKVFPGAAGLSTTILPGAFAVGARHRLHHDRGAPFGHRREPQLFRARRRRARRLAVADPPATHRSKRRHSRRHRVRGLFRLPARRHRDRRGDLHGSRRRTLSAAGRATSGLPCRPGRRADRRESCSSR